MFHVESSAPLILIPEFDKTKPGTHGEAKNIVENIDG